MRPWTRIPVAALLALVAAAPAQANHGTNVFSGSWTTNIGGVTFTVIDESQGAQALYSLAGQPCGAPTVYYRGDYYDANNTGVIVACERSAGHLVGRYVENSSSDPTGDGGIDITFQAPNHFSGYYTGDEYPGYTFTYTGTFQAHATGDGCCPANEPPGEPSDPDGPGQGQEDQIGECEGGIVQTSQEVLDNCYTLQPGPRPGKVAGLKAPTVGPKVTEVGADIKFYDDQGNPVEGPALVAIQYDRIAEKAGILCFTVMFKPRFAEGDWGGLNFIKCVDVVARILARHDQIAKKKGGGQATAARRGCGRVLRSRKRSRVKSKLRVTCSLTRTGAKVKIRPRSSRGTLRRALGSRKPKLFVGRSKLGPPGDVHMVTVWTVE